jgi:hypothetical protein
MLPAFLIDPSPETSEDDEAKKRKKIGRAFLSQNIIGKGPAEIKTIPHGFSGISGLFVNVGRKTAVIPVLCSELSWAGHRWVAVPVPPDDKKPQPLKGTAPQTSRLVPPPTMLDPGRAGAR